MALGTSVKDIVESENSLLQELCKGFSFQAKLTFVKALKTLVFNLMKDSETMDSELAPFLMGISPFILLTLNGEIDLKFEDFDDVKELPMMEPLLANFS